MSKSNSSTPKEVLVIAQRHGQKESGGNADQVSLTEHGRHQVSEAFKKNIVPMENIIDIQELAYSGLPRALQSVLSGYTNWHNTNLQNQAIVPDLRFGYKDIPGEDELLEGFTSLQGKPNVTVADWLKKAPTWTVEAKHRVELGLFYWAEQLLNSNEGSSSSKIPAAYICSHAPVFELACLDPENTPTMHEADIILFKIIQKDELLTIAESIYLPSGY